MGQNSYRVQVCLLVVSAILLLAGCAQKSPEEIVAETRTEYFLEPTGMLVQELPSETAEALGDDLAETEQGDGEAVASAAAEGAIAAEGEESEEMGGEEGMEEMNEGPRTVNVLFDLIIRFDGRKSLPGITVEVAHSDPFQKEKARHLEWIETEGMSRGDARQISFEKEIPDYETGDEFSIEFRPYIPPEERDKYREFSAGGS